MTGPSLAWVQWVHLHPWFLRNLTLMHRICTHRSICKQNLGFYVEFCTHALQILTTTLYYYYIIQYSPLACFLCKPYRREPPVPYIHNAQSSRSCKSVSCKIRKLENISVTHQQCQVCSKKNLAINPQMTGQG